MKAEKIKKLLLACLSCCLFLSLICFSAFKLADKTQNAYADDVQNVNADYVDVPYQGRTKWTNSSRPLGFVLYLKDVSFAANQVHLQNGIMTAESLAKITFTRGETSQCVRQKTAPSINLVFAFSLAVHLSVKRKTNT